MADERRDEGLPPDPQCTCGSPGEPDPFKHNEACPVYANGMQDALAPTAPRCRCRRGPTDSLMHDADCPLAKLDPRTSDSNVISALREVIGGVDYSAGIPERDLHDIVAELDAKGFRVTSGARPARAWIEGELTSVSSPGMGTEYRLDGEPIDLGALAKAAGNTGSSINLADRSFGKVKITIEVQNA